MTCSVSILQMSQQNLFNQKLNIDKDEIVSAFKFLLQFCKNPILQITQLPSWSWTTLVTVHIILTSLFGFLVGIFSLNIMGIVGSLILFPITSLFLISVLTGFFYYTFLFFFNEDCDLKKIVTIIFLAHLPNVVLAPFVDFIPPLGLLAVIAGSLLLIVGFSQNLNVRRPDITKIIGGLVLVYLVFWIFNMINFSSEPNQVRPQALPKSSIHILEKEFSSDEAESSESNTGSRN